MKIVKKTSFISKVLLDGTIKFMLEVFGEFALILGGIIIGINFTKSFSMGFGILLVIMGVIVNIALRKN